MGWWATIDERPRRWTFYCSACGGQVYWPQPTQGARKPRRCPFPRCPWCGEAMTDDKEASQ